MKLTQQISKGWQQLFGQDATNRRTSDSQESVAARWRSRRETERRLRCLSDRDLADIGIARRDIREIARQGAVIGCSPATASRRLLDPAIPSGWAEVLVPSRRLGSR